MSNIVTRAQFIEACPPDLKKRIDDFFVFYSQKKKQGPPSSSVPPPLSSAATADRRAGAGGYQSGGYQSGSGIRKASLTHFKKPFDKPVVSEFETAHVSFKGILSKLNENNQDSIWKELQALKLERFIPSGAAGAAAAAAAAAADDDGWTSVSSSSSHKKSSWASAVSSSPSPSPAATATQVKDLAQTMYLYSRNCHMYIKEYIELVSRFKQSHEWQMIGTQYIEAVMYDLDHPQQQQQQYNTLTHSVCSELFLRGLMTKTKYIECCLVQMGDGTAEHTEILIQNMTKCGALVAKHASVVKLREAIDKWIKEKKFSGKIHFNLIDLQDTF
jgi:hypothetical protein